MTLQRILIVSGTHGNEINPVWAVKQFNREENKLNHGIEYEYILGNPAAYEKGCRYIDVDLNRSFKESDNFDQHKNSFYETNRANFLVDEFGIDGSKPCQIAIDLHTTTANMGTSIVMYGRRSKDFCLAALLQNKFGLPIYLHEKDKAQTGFLVEAWPCGLVIEIGPVAQNFYDQNIVNRGEIGIQGSRPAEVIKLWLGLRFLGLNGIENILKSSIKRKDFFIKNINKNKFDIYSGPLHIVSFLPKKLEPKDSDAWTQAKVNELINNNFMLSRPKFKGKYFLRVVMGNYNTKDSHIEELLRLLDA